MKAAFGFTTSCEHPRSFQQRLFSMKDAASWLITVEHVQNIFPDAKMPMNRALNTARYILAH
jgi:hypothetical protein